MSAPGRPGVVDERGIGLVELLIALTVLSVAVAGLVAVFASSAVALQVSEQRGTALTLAESQMEVYRTAPFTGIRIDGTLIPASASDPYNTAHASDSTIPPSTGQAVAGQPGDDACPDSELPTACDPVQASVSGPDGHTYRVDTYVDYVYDNAYMTIRPPAAGLTLKRVTVVVRDTRTLAILARASSAFQGS